MPSRLLRLRLEDRKPEETFVTYTPQLLLFVLLPRNSLWLIPLTLHSHTPRLSGVLYPNLQLNTQTSELVKENSILENRTSGALCDPRLETSRLGHIA